MLYKRDFETAEVRKPYTRIIHSNCLTAIQTLVTQAGLRGLGMYGKYIHVSMQHSIHMHTSSSFIVGYSH